METKLNKALYILTLVLFFSHVGYGQNTNYDYLTLDRNDNAAGYVAFDAGRYKNSSDNWVYSENYGSIGVYGVSFANRVLGLYANKVIMTRGNMGIGTTNPTQKLEVVGTTKSTAFEVTGNATAMTINVNTGSYNAFRPMNGSQTLGQIHFFDDTWQSSNLNRSGGATNISGFRGVTLGPWNDPVLVVDQTQRSVKVDGVVRCREELTIHDATEAFPDYVFEESYDLRDLGKVEAFIKANKHLPEVPSAEEVGENGLGIYKMNTLLLKKVEELTLYTIAQEKQIAAQNERMEKMEALLEKLTQ